MKVFLYDDYSDLNVFFGGISTQEIPFLNSSMLKFTVMNLLLEEERPTIYAPWEKTAVYEHYDGNIVKILESSGKPAETIVLISPASVMAAPFSRDDIVYLQQNPGKLFSRNGIIAGHILDSELPTAPTETLENGFSNFVAVGLDNFLHVNQALVGQLRVQSSEYTGRRFGSPTVLSDKIQNSTICGPCYIDEDSSITNSYIGPGSVVLKSTIDDSTVLSSFVDDSFIDNSTIEDVLVTNSTVSGIALKNSKIPHGGFLHSNERKI